MEELNALAAKLQRTTLRSESPTHGRAAPTLSPVSGRNTSFGRDLCAAIDRRGQKCFKEKTRAEGREARWCSLHLAEQAIVYKSYKDSTADIKRSQRTIVETDPELVEDCEDLLQLKAWLRTLRQRHNLYTRVVAARTYHSEHFYGEDADFGHQKYIDTIKEDQERCEAVMYRIERRAHKLILSSGGASFGILNSLSRPQSPFILYGAYMRPRSTSPNKSDGEQSRSTSPNKKRKNKKKASPSKTAAQLSTQEEIDNPLEASYRERRKQVLDQLLKFFQHDTDDPRIAREHKLVYDTLIREIIIRNPRLTLAAQPYNSVDSFLNECKELDIRDLEYLVGKVEQSQCWCLKKAGKREPLVRNAVMNALYRRPGDVPEKERIQFLGDWVYTQAPLGELSVHHGWDHVYAFIACEDCALASTRSFVELCYIRIFSVAPLHSPRYLKWNLKFDEDDHFDKLFRALGIDLCYSCSDMQHSVYENSTEENTSVWTERQERGWLHFRMNLGSALGPSFQLLGKLGMSFPLVVRRGDTGEMQTDVDNKNSWQDTDYIDEHSFDAMTGLEGSVGLDFRKQVYEVFVLDQETKITSGPDRWTDFYWDVLDIMIEHRGVNPEHSEAMSRGVAECGRCVVIEL